MARTMTAGQALNIVSLKYPRVLADGFGARFADEVQSAIWYAYPWRESLVELPPFHPILGEPDVGPPMVVVPADFYGLHDAWVRNKNGWVVTPPLLVKPELPVSAYEDIPTAVAYQREKKAFRLHPRPSITAPEWWVEGVYKKTPAKITNETLNSYVLPWDDLYFEVFRKGLVWKVKEEILGDPDAAQAFQLFLRLVKQMAAAEGLHSGVVTVAPAASLELGG